MKKLIALFLMLVVAYSGQAQQVCLSTPHTTLLLSAPQGGELRFLYYGEKLSEVDARSLPSAVGVEFPAYPAYGLNCSMETALSVRMPTVT